MFKKVCGKAQRAKGRVVLLCVRRASERSENVARSRFQHPTERGRPVSTGILIPPWHVELSGTRQLRENATANQELALAA